MLSSALTPEQTAQIMELLTAYDRKQSDAQPERVQAIVREMLPEILSAVWAELDQALQHTAIKQMSAPTIISGRLFQERPPTEE